MRISRLFIFCFLAMAYSSLAQTTTDSPYSFYGLGDINSRAFANQRSMGGAGTALAEDAYVNTLNPATLGSLRKTTFSVDFNLDLKTMESTSVSQKTTRGYFNNLSVAFPIGKRAGISANLRQYTKIGYNIEADQTDVVLGEYQFIYDGKGGVNEFLFGAGYSIISDTVKTLSFGANFIYYFGSAITNRRATNYTDSQDALSSNQRNTSRVRDLAYDFGLYFDYRFSKLTKIALGATYAPSVNLSSTINTVAYNYRSINGDELIKDTVVFSSTNGETKMPSSINFGVALDLGKSWKVLADYQYQDWSELTILGNNANLNSRSIIAIGVQNIPNPDAVAKFLQSFSYRAGYRFTNTRLNVNSQSVTEYAITAGLGIPLMKSKTSSTINIGMEFGNRGAKENGLIKESFTNFYLGISFNPMNKQRWFKPSKYY